MIVGVMLLIFIRSRAEEKSGKLVERCRGLGSRNPIDNTRIQLQYDILTTVTRPRWYSRERFNLDQGSGGIPCARFKFASKCLISYNIISYA